MALDLAHTLTDDFGPERKLRNRIRLRLLEPQERERFDALLTRLHSLQNPMAVGAVLRYVVTDNEQWLGVGGVEGRATCPRVEPCPPQART